MRLTCVQKRNLAALFLRFGLGGLFLYSGIGKLTSPNPAGLYATVANSQLLPAPIDLVFATALPYWEVMFGVFFIVGVFTRMTAVAALLAFISYTIYLAQPASQTRLATVGLASAMINHNVAYMLMCVAIGISGAGAYSVDALIAVRHKLARGWSAVIGAKRFKPHVSGRLNAVIVLRVRQFPVTKV
jgi:uncharacterized membrane protein YphA (DoxX/SURF4 family)